MHRIVDLNFSDKVKVIFDINLFKVITEEL